MPLTKDRANADVPGVNGSRMLVHASGLRLRKAGPSTKKIMPSVLGVSSPKGMAVMVLRPVCASQAKGQPEEQQIAHEHADGRAGDHAAQGKLCRKFKDAVEQADRQEQIGDVI